MVSEDFSFPIMSYQLQNLAVTPSLWRVSSTVYPSDYYEGEAAAAAAEDDHFSECEEKMDMLWEDFNEELKRVCSLKDKKMAAAAAVKLSNDQQSAAGVKMTEASCMQATGNSRMINYNKRSGKSSLLVIKFLKKFFSTRAAHMKKN